MKPAKGKPTKPAPKKGPKPNLAMAKALIMGKEKC